MMKPPAPWPKPWRGNPNEHPTWVYFKPGWIGFWRGGYFVYGYTTEQGTFLVRRARHSYTGDEVDAFVKPAIGWAQQFSRFNVRIILGKGGQLDAVFFRRKKDAMLFKMKFC
jgi:hypothetical protein